MTTTKTTTKTYRVIAISIDDVDVSSVETLGDAHGVEYPTREAAAIVAAELAATSEMFGFEGARALTYEVRAVW